MFETMVRILLVAIHLLTHTTLSQSSICVSGATSDYIEINGLYTSAGTKNGKAYYEKSAPSGCFTYYIYWDSDQVEWLIDDDLDTSWLTAYCHSSSISDCHSNWYVYDYASSDWEVDSSLHSSFGSCVTIIWQCDTISIPSLPNPCDELFDVHLGDNVWSNSANTLFWYWNEYHYMWQCNDRHPDSGQCANEYYAWTTRTWVDISNGESKSLSFESPDYNSHTVYCIMDPTPSPTNKPTPKPTANPSFKPTSTPTDMPVVASTSVPTSLPTDMPFTAPTLSPTDMPFTSVTSIFSIAPTLDPSTSTRHQIIARNPTSYFKEGEVPQITTLTPRATLVTDSEEPNDGDKSMVWLLVYIALAVVVSCLVCVMIMCLYYRKIDNAKNQNKMSDLVHANGVNKQAVPDKPNMKVVPVPDRNTSIKVIRVYSEDNNDNEKEAQGEKTAETNGDGVGITEGENDQAIYDERNKKQRAALKEWLELKVKLPQYYDTLVMNGYDTLDIVQEITEADELRAIGITLQGHILKLMKEFKRLNSFVETVE